jgi:hypothetical protein
VIHWLDWLILTYMTGLTVTVWTVATATYIRARAGESVDYRWVRLGLALWLWPVFAVLAIWTVVRDP